MWRLYLGSILMALGIIITDFPWILSPYGGATAPGLGSAMIVLGAVLIGFYLQAHHGVHVNRRRS